MAEHLEVIKVGILTVSDTCSTGKASDRSGENLKCLVESGKYFRGSVVAKDIIPDETAEIKAKLLHWSDHLKLDLILTTGGTGFSLRDVTPEATKAVLEKEAIGLSIAMIKGSLDITPKAMLTRLICGTRGTTLIINLPGSMKGSAECLQIVSEGIPHAVDLLNDRSSNIVKTHSELQRQTGSQNQASASKQDYKSKVNVEQVALRPRESPHPIITVEQALSKVLDNTPVLCKEKVPASEALGRYLAAPVFAADPLPPFRASIKDGYALKAADGAGLFKVGGDSAMGDMPEKLVASGTCIRISTGAAVPEGADAVVQVEDTELVEASTDGTTEIRIKILKAATVGQDIRQIGSDIAKGQQILCIGQRLGPAQLGLLATVGVTSVECYRMPLVGVMSTGNELLEPGEPLTGGMIRDCNRTSLLAQLKDVGVPVLDLGIAQDTPDDVFYSFSKALDKVDIIVTSGGVSMGHKDCIKQVLEMDLQADLHFARVFMKPGKPTTFATMQHKGQNKLFFNLPGNPVSALVTCNLYVIPAVRKMMGCPNPHRTVLKVKVDSDLKLDPRPEYHRAYVKWSDDDPVPTAVSTGNQISSRLLSVNTANVLLKFPPRSETLTSLKKGTVVDALVIGDL